MTIAGPVTIRRSDGSVEQRPPYSSPEHAAVLRGGHPAHGGTATIHDVAGATGRSPAWIRRRARELGGRIDGAGQTRRWVFVLDEAVQRATDLAGDG